MWTLWSVAIGSSMPFAGERDHPLGDRRVAVAGVRQRVDVRVAGDVAGRGHFAADRKLQLGRAAGSQR